MSNCIVCNSSSLYCLYKGIEKCKTCGHVFADLSISSAELFAIYQKSYFFGDEYSNYIADRRVASKNFNLRLRTLSKYLRPERHRRLFEIGCAYGFFLEVAQPYFETVKGIDITEDGINYASNRFGSDVVQADFIEYDLEGQYFDVSCMWDTIEHLPHPHLFIEKLSTCMEKGGLLAITTGDIESFNSRFRKENWRLIHPPTHIHYFSKQSITRLLNNYGFDVIYIGYCGFYRSLDNTMYNILALRWKQPKLYKLLLRTGILNLDFYLNLYDIMYIIAKKKY